MLFQKGTELTVKEDEVCTGMMWIRIEAKRPAESSFRGEKVVSVGMSY